MSDLGGPLKVRLGSAIYPGNDPGKQFRVKRREGDVLVNDRANTWEGTLTHWRRIGVLAGTKDQARFFVLEPGQNDDELRFADFFVRGKFRIVEKINNAQQARRAYSVFTAE
jgi:hypothetical protein